MSFIVAIDGPAGTGKGTLASRVAEEFNLLNVDTGAMFRCVTLLMLDNDIALEDEEKIKELLKEIKIELKEENGKQIVISNGRDVTKDIRTERINKAISEICKIQIIREKLLELQREIARNQDVVMEGRDIGTVVFPNANIKIYLDATPEERAKRRVKQNEEKGILSEYQEILESIKRRDEIDSTREIAPLKKAEDAIYVDSSGMSVDEMCDVVFKIIRERY